MRGPLAALSERFGRRRLGGIRSSAAAPPPPLSPDMARGAAELQARLEEARSRLRRDIAPPPDDGR